MANPTDLTDEKIAELKREHVAADDGICAAAHDGCCIGWGYAPCIVYKLADEAQAGRIVAQVLEEAGRDG